MELSMHQLKENLEHTSRERDKALQELDRLKQHILDKVICFNLLLLASYPFYSYCSSKTA